MAAWLDVVQSGEVKTGDIIVNVDGKVDMCSMLCSFRAHDRRYAGDACVTLDRLNQFAHDWVCIVFAGMHGAGPQGPDAITARCGGLHC